jgi:AraC family transcriptional regulator
MELLLPLSREKYLTVYNNSKMQENPMKPELKFSEERKIIGKRKKMSFAGDFTFELWNGFMPLRNLVTHRLNNDLISMQDYGDKFDFQNPDLSQTFEKWAAAEVSDFSVIPEGMETFVIPAGYYAVFHYHGIPSGAPVLFQNIFGVWLPAEGYKVDNRPHFEILGEKYKHNSPESEEEVWIPVNSEISQR